MKRAIFAAALLSVSLTGCMLNPKQTYTDYVQAVMDCSYRNITNKYMELTDSTAAEAQEVYDDEVEYVTYLLCEYNSVVSDYISDGTYAGYRSLAERILRKTSYSVEPAVKSGSVYHVTVVGEPIDFWDITYDPVEELYTEEFADRFGAFDYTSYEEAEADPAYLALEEEWGVSVLMLLGDYVDQIGYGASQSIIVEITIDEDNVYGISDKNWLDIDDLLLGLDGNAY